MKYNLYIPGVPVGMPRPRATNAGGHARLYTQKSHPVNQYKADIRQAALAEGVPWLEGPVKLSWSAFFPRPKRLMRKKDPAGAVAHTGKPDRDNIDKAILDALSGVIFKDDKAIFCGLIAKYYLPKNDPTPCTLIEIEVINGD